MRPIAAPQTQGDTSAADQDLLHVDAGPLRTATGFVLGTILSGAMWTVAGVVTWYCT